MSVRILSPSYIMATSHVDLLLFLLLALQPIVGLYFAALQRGYSLLAYEVS
jgi:nitrate reductase gamma subunit